MKAVLLHSLEGAAVEDALPRFGCHAPLRDSESRTPAATSSTSCASAPRRRSGIRCRPALVDPCTADIHSELGPRLPVHSIRVLAGGIVALDHRRELLADVVRQLLAPRIDRDGIRAS